MKKDHLLDAFQNKEITKITMNKFTGGLSDYPTEVDHRTSNPDAPGGWESDCYVKDMHRVAPTSSNSAS